MKKPMICRHCGKPIAMPKQSKATGAREAMIKASRDRAIHAAGLRSQGMLFREIAAELGVSASRANDIVRKGRRLLGLQQK